MGLQPNPPTPFPKREGGVWFSSPSPRSQTAQQAQDDFYKDEEALTLDARARLTGAKEDAIEAERILSALDVVRVPEVP